MYRPPRQQHRQVRIRAPANLPEPGELGTMILNGTATFAKRNKVISGAYLFGILVLILGSGGIALTQSQAREYHRIMATVDVQAEMEAQLQFLQDDQNYRQSRGWFWTCNTPRCQHFQQRSNQSKAHWDAVRAEGQARMSDAKAVAGLWSDVAADEVKQSFWSRFQNAKNFAKRQTMWDALWMGVGHMTRGRDESTAEFILRLVMAFLVNFSMGLVMALLFFVWSLWGIVTSYQPNPAVAVLFFCGATCAAFAFVLTYFVGLVGAIGGGLYGVAKLAETQARNQRIGQQQQQQQRMGYRPHYE